MPPQKFRLSHQPLTTQTWPPVSLNPPVLQFQIPFVYYQQYLLTNRQHHSIQHFSLFLSFTFPHQNSTCISLLPPVCHTPYPSYPSFYHPNVYWRV